MNKIDRIRVIIADDRKADAVISVLQEFKPKSLEEIEFRHVYKTLKHFNGVRTQAAQALKISYSTLTRTLYGMKLAGYKIPPIALKCGGQVELERVSGAV